MSKQLQWYPGHMHKTMREFNELSSKIDIFFLLLDARAPKSSLMQPLVDMIKNKKIIVLLTKSDLVEKNELKKWKKYYEQKFGSCYSISLSNQREVRKKIITILGEQKFNKLLPKFSIIGIPNVGKSTLLNILSEKKAAKVEDRAGVTKNISWYQFEKKYWILDTPGVLEPKFEDEKKGVILASIGSIKVDILPLEDVVEGLLEIFGEKNIETKYGKNYLEVLNRELNSSKLTPKDFYKSIIIDFQKGKFGKIILDTFE